MAQCPPPYASDGYDFKDVLATRRFALLFKSLQWNRKIHCGNSWKWILTSFEIFGAVFLFIRCGNAVPAPLFLSLHPLILVRMSDRKRF